MKCTIRFKVSWFFSPLWEPLWVNKFWPHWWTSIVHFNAAAFQLWLNFIFQLVFKNVEGIGEQRYSWHRIAKCRFGCKSTCCGSCNQTCRSRPKKLQRITSENGVNLREKVRSERSKWIWVEWDFDELPHMRQDEILGETNTCLDVLNDLSKVVGGRRRTNWRCHQSNLEVPFRKIRKWRSFWRS